MLTENWREWLRLFIAEIDGQIDAGCFHWAVLPEGHKLLNPVVVFTQKLHADFTYERGKARVCVDDSRGKPGEYADVCAHVAQLSTYKYQVAVCVELEGKLYSGDWTQAYLNAINTAEQYMRVPDGIRRRYNADGTQQVSAPAGEGSLRRQRQRGTVGHVRRHMALRIWLHTKQL